MKKSQKIIIEMNSKYYKRIEKLRNEFILCSQKFDLIILQNIMSEYRILLKKIIIDIAEKYKELKKADFLMFNGSFARHSNIFSSDLDLNIMYQDRFRKILLPIELEINYILSKVLDFKGCDRIHSIMVYTPLISSESPNLINNAILKFQFGQTDYYCRENYEQLLYETCNSSRDYLVLLQYINSFKNKLLKEWENNFELIVDYGKYKDFEKKIINLRTKKLLNMKSEILLNNIDNILSQINSYKFLKRSEDVYIKDFKKIIKSIPLDIIYQTLTIITAKTGEKLELDNLTENEFISKDLINNIYTYLWVIIRIQFVFEIQGFDLSSHSSKKININYLKDIYLKYYNDDIIEQTNYILKILFENLKKILIKRKEELNG